jgi:hypothetical protein
MRSRSGILANVVGVTQAPAMIDPQVAAVGPTRLLQRLQECRVVRLSVGIVRGKAAGEPADTPHAITLLRSCHDWQRRRAQPRNELPPSHPLVLTSIVEAYRDDGSKGTGQGVIAAPREAGLGPSRPPRPLEGESGCRGEPATSRTTLTGRGVRF